MHRRMRRGRTAGALLLGACLAVLPAYFIGQWVANSPTRQSVGPEADRLLSENLDDAASETYGGPGGKSHLVGKPSVESSATPVDVDNPTESDTVTDSDADADKVSSPENESSTSQALASAELARRRSEQLRSPMTSAPTKGPALGDPTAPPALDPPFGSKATVASQPASLAEQADGPTVDDRSEMLLVVTRKVENPFAMRDWTANDGARIVASLVRWQGDSVILRTADDQDHRLPLSRLSREDVEFIRANVNDESL